MQNSKFHRLLEDHQNVLVLSNYDKQQVLKYLCDHDSYSKAQLIQDTDLSTQTNDEYIQFMYSRFHMSPSLSVQIRPYFDFIDPSVHFKNPKLAKIQEIKKVLYEHNILFQPSMDRLVDKTIWIVGNADVPAPFIRGKFKYDRINLLSEIEEEIHVSQSITVDSYIERIMAKITELLSMGISPNQIHLMNGSEKDFYHLSKWLRDGNIPFYDMANHPLSSFPLTISFLKTIKHSGLEKGLEKLNQWSLSASVLEGKVIQAIYDIVNRYEEGKDQAIELILYEINQKRMKFHSDNKGIRFDHQIRMDLFERNHHLILNYDDSSLPRIVQNQDYLLDDEKQLIGMDPTSTKNQQERRNLIELMERIPNCHVFCYKYDKSLTRQFLDLNLSRVLQFQENNSQDFYAYYPSRLLLKNRISQSKTTSDRFVRYDPRFIGISAELCNRLISSKVRLSATSLKTFIECPFHFLLSHMLKMDSLQPSYSLYYGNIVHKLIELENKHLSYDLAMFLQMSKADFPEPYKTEVFFPILEKRLRTTLDVINQIRSQSSFDAFANELNLSFEYLDDKRFQIVGKIDQVFQFQEDDNSFYAIVDYKTGSIQFDVSEILAMKQIQLPLYATLFKQAYPNSNQQISGLYYQSVNLPKKKLNEDISKHFIYDGFHLKNLQILERFSSFEYLKSVSVLVDGSLKNSTKLLDPLEFEHLLDRTEAFIRSSVDKIKAGLFEIDPIPVSPGKKESKSCEYCLYSNICFMANHKKYIIDTEDEVNDDGE